MIYYCNYFTQIVGERYFFHIHKPEYFISVHGIHASFCMGMVTGPLVIS